MKLLIPYTEIPTEPPSWLIKDQLTQNSLAAIFGAAGEGKSFIALDIAYSIATGESFHGYEVQKGNVIFVAGEGHGGLKKGFELLKLPEEILLEIISSSAHNQYPLAILNG